MLRRMADDDAQPRVRVGLGRRLRQKWLIWSLAADARTRAALEMRDFPDAGDLLELDLRGLPRPIVARHGCGGKGGADDRRTVWELFRRRPYASPLWRDCGSLLDVGANAGLLAVWLAVEGTLPKTYAAIEADPDSARVLREQVKRLGRPDARVIEAAAGDRAGTAKFDTGGDSMFHGLSDAGGVEVRLAPLADLMDEAGLAEVDVMKLDIEGGEAAVIPTAADWAGRVGAIVCELHNGLDRAWLESHLRPHGYRVFDFGTLVREGHAAVREDRLERLPARWRGR